jgi:uncharacterized protein (TIGR02284 family)
MRMSTTTDRHILKNLIQILHDGRDGYRQAADHVLEQRLKDLFETFATQRSQFAQELEPHLASAGEENAEEGGTVGGVVHRGWINLKAAVTEQNAHAILAEVERGEDSAKQVYHDALQAKDFSADVRRVVANQAAEVLIAHNQIRDLRDAVKKS